MFWWLMPSGVSHLIVLSQSVSLTYYTQTGSFSSTTQVSNFALIDNITFFMTAYSIIVASRRILATKEYLDLSFNTSKDPKHIINSILNRHGIFYKSSSPKNNLIQLLNHPKSTQTC